MLTKLLVSWSEKFRAAVQEGPICSLRLKLKPRSCLESNWCEFYSIRVKNLKTDFYDCPFAQGQFCPQQARLSHMDHQPRQSLTDTATIQSDQSNSSTEVSSSQVTPGCVKMTIKTNQDTHILVSNPQHTDCVTKINFGGLSLSSILHLQFNLTSHSLIDWQVRRSWIFQLFGGLPIFPPLGIPALVCNAPPPVMSRRPLPSSSDQVAMMREQSDWKKDCELLKLQFPK